MQYPRINVLIVIDSFNVAKDVNYSNELSGREIQTISTDK